MPRATYNKEFPIDFGFGENGEVTKRIVYRMQNESGQRIRFCVGYQVRDPQTGRLKDIVRYDDAHGYLHRHSAGFPPGRDHIRVNLPPGVTDFGYITTDIMENADLYEAEAVRYGYEVPEDADDEELD